VFFPYKINRCVGRGGVFLLLLSFTDDNQRPHKPSRTALCAIAPRSNPGFASHIQKPETTNQKPSSPLRLCASALSSPAPVSKTIIRYQKQSKTIIFDHSQAKNDYFRPFAYQKESKRIKTAYS
jgi:hypothetical protein